ncbi:hypothetical protein, partial [Acinetobacter baumannii]|uniref:hypothetical protein n=1 Tax=Acinetobacter baumannii TaxID=470 RepID=UPI001C06A785
GEKFSVQKERLSILINSEKKNLKNSTKNFFLVLDQMMTSPSMTMSQRVETFRVGSLQTVDGGNKHGVS